MATQGQSQHPEVGSQRKCHKFESQIVLKKRALVVGTVLSGENVLLGECNSFLWLYLFRMC